MKTIQLNSLERNKKDMGTQGGVRNFYEWISGSGMYALVK